MNPALPKISLVTPSLNQGKFIRATIESVLSQQYPDLDYRVQDGGSTDGTLAVLKEHAGRVPFVSEKDAGQADAINKGLAHATGEVIGYLNSDDVLRPGALAAVGEAFAADPDLVFVWGRAAYIDEDGTPSRRISCGPTRSSVSRTPVSSRSGGVLPAKSVGGNRPLRRIAPPHHGLRLLATDRAKYPASRTRFLDRELAGCRMHAGAKTVAGWSRALEEIMDS